MQKEFIKYLRDVCGVSGSKRFCWLSAADRFMVMLKLFHLSGLDFALAHCNFHLPVQNQMGISSSWNPLLMKQENSVMSKISIP